MIKILDFYASWCNPCKNMKKLLLRLLEEYPDIEIEEIDIEENIEDTEDFNVRSVPTLIFISDDEVKCRHVGTTSYEKLSSIIEQLKVA